MTTRRRSALRVGLLVAGCVLVLGLPAGWGLASQFQSPAQREATTTPPPKTPVTVAVQHGTLDRQITARADVGPATTTTLGLNQTDGVVTGQPRATGDTVSSGTVVAEVNGRPVFVLAGRFRFYRDLASGDTGPDVRQLQDALRARGSAIPASESGTFAQATERAVTALYKAAGYQVQTRTEPSPDAQPGQSAPTATPTPGTTPPRTVVQLPRAELLVAQGLPATLSAVPPVGTDASGANVTLTSGGLVARARIAASTSAEIRPGAAAALTSDTGERVDAVVAEGDRPPADQPGQQGGTGEVLVPITGRSPLPAAWAGRNVLATITLSASSGESLLVPAQGIVADPDGKSYVVKRQSDGTFARVEVHELDSVSGMTAVTPVGDDLRTGDVVQVG